MRFSHLWIGGVCFLGTAVHAQTPMGDASSLDNSGGDIEAQHTVHVTPQLILLDAQNKSASVTFSNTGNDTLSADVMVQYAYTYWPSKDTALMSPPDHAPDYVHDARDTIVLKPSSTDMSAARWISGIPSHLKLVPHQTQRVTLHITPPAHLKTGEYFARLVTIAHPYRPKGAKNLDTQQRYVLPVQGDGPPMLRDSARIYYRQGPQTLGVRMTGEAGIDPTRASANFADDHGLGPNPLRVMVRLHLTGTMHFEGYTQSYVIRPNGSVDTMAWGNGRPGSHLIGAYIISLQKDAIQRWLMSTRTFPPGHYTLVERLIPYFEQYPAGSVPRMDTVKAEIPFDMPQ